jgi:hypothetical protein
MRMVLAILCLAAALSAGWAITFCKYDPELAHTKAVGDTTAKYLVEGTLSNGVLIRVRWICRIDSITGDSVYLTPCKNVEIRGAVAQ